jgi:hypothetical protein
MAPKVKEAMGVVSDVLETACGWAICAVALYSILFVNMTGNGTLWDAIRGVVMEAPAAAPKRDVAVQTRVVPARPVDAAAKAQNHMLLIPDEPEKEFSVPVLAAQQPARAADQITDAPADAKAGADWRKHLNGSLRTFTVYGDGDQARVTSSGAASSGKASVVAAPSAVRTVAVAATPATAASPYRAGMAAEARPGISDHVSRVGDAADGVNNFR